MPQPNENDKYWLLRSIVTKLMSVIKVHSFMHAIIFTVPEFTQKRNWLIDETSLNPIVKP